MSPVRVLVVDDDFRVGRLHQEVVEARPGYAALPPARGFAEADAAIRTGAPDLLLVDVYLPDGDGVELVRRHEVDALVVSAATDADLVRRALRAGAFGVLTKPFARTVLEERLDAYLRFRNLLPPGAETTQAGIDRALRLLQGTEQGDSARRATEQLVLDGLGGEEASAAEVAARIGVSRATAQRHLAALAAAGRVEVRLRYGSTGRPEHRYARRG